MSKKEKLQKPEPDAEATREAAAVPAEETGHEAAPNISPEITDLENQLAEAQSQASEYKDGWQRSVAEFQNFRRRVDTEKAETYQNAVGNIIKRYLPILDDLERALANRPSNLAWVDGVELIYRKLQSILEAEGVKRIEAEGQIFDPNFHEAIALEPAEGVESGRIIAVLQNGYMLGDRVIRPAQVRVAK